MHWRSWAGPCGLRLVGLRLCGGGPPRVFGRPPGLGEAYQYAVFGTKIKRKYGEYVKPWHSERGVLFISN